MQAQCTLKLKTTYMHNESQKTLGYDTMVPRKLNSKACKTLVSTTVMMVSVNQSHKIPSS